MKYFPSKRKAQEMLAELGMESLDELFADVPDEIKVDGLDLPDGISEMKFMREVNETLARNKDSLSFLGGGVYHHFVPAAVRAILSRSEFYTAYTPYQPEASQGILQAFFEYQCFISELTGMPVSNISLYDASSSVAEAILMACRINRKATNVVITSALPRHRKSVIGNYVKGADIELRWLGHEDDTGQIVLSQFKGLLGTDTAAVYVENPNYFGILDKNLLSLKELIQDISPKTALIVGINPLSLFAVKPPSSYGADIVVGEGQIFGATPNYGGPLTGIFATTKNRKYIIQMPGRIIGMTKDADGKWAYTMTLQSREQHIKREKATSNICTNQGLCAIASSVHLAIMGKTGMMELARQNMENARYLGSEIGKLEGFSLPFKDSPVFNEFVVRSDRLPFAELQKKATEAGIVPGLGLEEHFPELKNCFLVNTTELHSKEDLERLVGFLRRA